MSKRRVPSRARGRVLRRGSACVELAVCLPMIALISLGAIEGSNKIFVRQAAIQAAYEAAKVVAGSSGRIADGITIADQVLIARNIDGETVEFDPPNADRVDSGTVFTVTIRVPGDARSVTGFGPFVGLPIDASASMIKE